MQAINVVSFNMGWHHYSYSQWRRSC